MEEYWGVEFELHSCFNFAPQGGEWSAACPRTHLQEAWWAPDTDWKMWGTAESPAPARNDKRFLGHGAHSLINGLTTLPQQLWLHSCSSLTWTILHKYKQEGSTIARQVKGTNKEVYYNTSTHNKFWLEKVHCLVNYLAELLGVRNLVYHLTSYYSMSPVLTSHIQILLCLASCHLHVLPTSCLAVCC
jgi:hypothetical protein